MATLDIRIEQLRNALDRLHEALEKYHSPTVIPEEKSFFNDSVIQRFEFCVDLFWKCLKDYIAIHHKLMVASPRTTMQESFNQNIITQDELGLFAEMVDDRNNSSHRYDQTMASDIVNRVNKYYDFMVKIVQKLAKN